MMKRLRSGLRWLARVPLALLAVVLSLPVSAGAQSMRMMTGGSMMGGMMWAMVIFWLLIAVLVVLAIAALIKYIFGGK